MLINKLKLYNKIRLKLIKQKQNKTSLQLFKLYLKCNDLIVSGEYEISFKSNKIFILKYYFE